MPSASTARPSTAWCADDRRKSSRLGTELAVVIGGGNIFRGVAGGAVGHGPRDGRLHGHAGHRDERAGAGRTRCARRASRRACMSAHRAWSRWSSPTCARRRCSHLEEGKVVIFAAGTGNPFFTTDTAAALRGAEIGARDRAEGHQGRRRLYRRPEEGPDATRYASISFDEAIGKNLQVMDATAFALCRDQNLPIQVFTSSSRARSSASCWARTKARWCTSDTAAQFAPRRSGARVPVRSDERS